VEIIQKFLDHYAVEFYVALIIVAVTLFRKACAKLLTACFSPIRVDGQWDTMLDRGKGYGEHEHAQLYQFLNLVWGVTKDDHSGYKVQGRVTGDRLCLTYRQADRMGSDCGAILLSINPGGKEMNGKEIGVDHEKSVVYAYSYMWKRRT
jgi:hypothetical protein